MRVSLSPAAATSRWRMLSPASHPPQLSPPPRHQLRSPARPPLRVAPGPETNRSTAETQRAQRNSLRVLCVLRASVVRILCRRCSQPISRPILLRHRSPPASVPPFFPTRYFVPSPTETPPAAGSQFHCFLSRLRPRTPTRIIAKRKAKRGASTTK